ncbi:unnamed protein product [Eruca vesicaria subsp. sativa]|uniref:PSP proline-rich domain-containing protein n=1 Tax=Eruca vesicaria subsp. sativa TaxID=29727 RepID=A0ABC8JG28_ERUVS|nr:unnamed protein product [Eruca vesicaria subsp. sativa]
MEAEDALDLPASGSSCLELQTNGLESGIRSPEANLLVGNQENMERDLDRVEESFRTVGGEISSEQVSHVVAVDEKVCVQKETLIHSATLDVSSDLGVKRLHQQQPTVHVYFKHLTRASKQKLESLLQQWSEWDAEYTSQAQEQEQPLESGEETYFSALRVGLQKTSSVSFWIDNQTGPKPLEEFVLVESSTTPLYDRKFALGSNSANGSNSLQGGVEIIDYNPPRCFNCGGYSHSLRECLKPFDRSAVNSARKLQKSKRNLNSGSRLPSRYYQKTQSGKYDGLKPGTLDAETRQLLNLGELDPPPWLNRMREIGYPPGYLAPEDDHMSGITIFGDNMEETREEIESEDGEILEKANPPEPQMKMTVEFPGINAPLPENADEWLWEASAPSHRSSRSNNNRWQQRTSRGHDCRDDDQFGFESSSYPPRYGSRSDYGYGSKDRRSRSRSPIMERSLTERSKRDYYSSRDPDFVDRNRNRDRNRGWDRDIDWDRDDRNRDRGDRDRDWDRDRDDRDWSYRLSSRR